MMEQALPSSWFKIALKDIIELAIGGDWGKDPSLSLESEYVQVQCLRGSEIKNWNKEKGSSASIRMIKKRSLDKRKLQIGDILVEISGGGPDQPVGRTVIIDNEVLTFQSDVPKICSNFLRLLRLSKHIDSKYINYYLQYFYKTGEIIKYQAGSNNLRNLNFKEYIQILVPVAPLAEQKRIVAKLDEAFQHLETLKAKLDRIPELLKKFRETVLTHAVSGSLTQKWRANNDFKLSIELLEDIRNRTKEAKKIVFLENVEDRPFEIPSQWTFTYLGALAEKITYGTSAKSENDGTIPVLRMGNLQKGKINWSDLKFTSDPEELKKYKLIQGDVLFNRTNSPELVGKTSIFEGNKPAIYAGYLMKIWNYPELHSRYLNYLLNTPYARSWCWQVKTDGVSQSNINAQKLLNFVVPFPSMEEQLQIVKIVDDLLSKSEVIEAHYSSLKLKIESIPQALLTKAFKGNLMSQDQNDESADVLLEKIKTLNRTLLHENKKAMDIKI